MGRKRALTGRRWHGGGSGLGTVTSTGGRAPTTAKAGTRAGGQKTLRISRWIWCIKSGKTTNYLNARLGQRGRRKCHELTGNRERGGLCYFLSGVASSPLAQLIQHRDLPTGRAPSSERSASPPTLPRHHPHPPMRASVAPLRCSKQTDNFLKSLLTDNKAIVMLHKWLVINSIRKQFFIKFTKPLSLSYFRSHLCPQWSPPS